MVEAHRLEIQGTAQDVHQQTDKGGDVTPEQAQSIGDMLTNAVNSSVASIAAMADAFRRIQLTAPKPDRWVMMMRPKVYSRLLPRSRQKMQPYVRKAWRQCSE